MATIAFIFQTWDNAIGLAQVFHGMTGDPGFIDCQLTIKPFNNQYFEVLKHFYVASRYWQPEASQYFLAQLFVLDTVGEIDARMFYASDR